MNLSAKEIERARITFSMYDFEGLKTIDAYYLGPALRALGLTPSLAIIRNLGGTETKREKVLSIEEFLSLYADARKKKDMGTIDDFVECLRSNDKNGDGMISIDHLGHILQAYGEKLDSDEVAEIIQECGNPQDGFIAYVPFLKHLLDGPDLEVDTCLTDAVSALATDVPKTKPKLQRTISEDTDTVPALAMSSAKPMEKLSNIASALKTPSKTRIPSVSEEPKAAVKAAAVLKPKNQQALISMKTMAMIGSIK